MRPEHFSYESIILDPIIDCVQTKNEKNGRCYFNLTPSSPAAQWWDIKSYYLAEQRPTLYRHVSEKHVLDFVFIHCVTSKYNSGKQNGKLKIQY